MKDIHHMAALTRKPLSGFPEGIDVRPPEDSSSFSKHDRDFYRIQALREDYMSRPAKEIYQELTEYEETLFRDLYSDPSSHGDDIAGLTSSDSEISEMVTYFGHVYPMMGTWISKMLSGKKFTKEEIAFKKEWIQTIKDKGHALYAYWKPFSGIDLKVVIERLKKRGTKERPDMTNLNWIDVSGFASMGGLFKGVHFNGDISLWDVSKVTIMSHMFEKSSFSGDISGWDVSNVRTMSKMFAESPFNGDISAWKDRLGSVTNMSAMFFKSAFNRDIPGWKLPELTNASAMFMHSKFNGSVEGWEFPRLESTRFMFCGDTSYEATVKYPFEDMTPFCQDLSSWDVSGITDMESMFRCCWFDRDISGWQVSPDCNTDKMFRNCEIREIWMPSDLQGRDVR